jgi:hypothetical protein
LDAYFSTVARLTSSFKLPRDVGFFLEGHLINVRDPGELAVTTEARISFELAWGIGVGEQLELEKRLVEDLERDFLSVLRSGRWLENLTEVYHGPGLRGVNTTFE